jgi:hypothetical protein
MRLRQTVYGFSSQTEFLDIDPEEARSVFGRLAQKNAN